ncbi:MAG: prepilin-type N-terminal cleavage/methylation domain-containing protein [Burkholderiales bacterium]|nr:prepilin-type N-terminal cleavage/methylation domain-containing protein [Burkholderiales bacterium]
MHILRKMTGVTLVELIVVIAITSIIAATVAVFIRRPVEGYADAARRAALTDEADTALRRITRDLRLALPNSIRVDPTGKFVEFIETSGGGRYRAEPDSGGGGNTLDFSAADSSFDVLGPVPALVAGNQVVVYNLYSTGATSSAYAGDNRAAFSSVAGSTINIASTQFPEPSPAKRFHVVTGAVTYGCSGGQLVRYWGYGYNAAQVAPPAGGSSAVLAGNVDAGECLFVYTAGALTERIGTVSIVLQINSTTAGGGLERVRMFQQAQVSNAP